MKMKIRFVINKSNRKESRYSLEIRKCFGWKSFGWHSYGYGVPYFQTYFDKSKKEILKKLKGYYNKKNIEIVQYPSIRKYNV